MQCYSIVWDAYCIALMRGTPSPLRLRLPLPLPPPSHPVFMRILYIRNCFCSRSLIFNLAASINQPTRTPAVSHQQAVNTACNASKQTAHQQTASSQPSNRLQPYATYSILYNTYSIILIITYYYNLQPAREYASYNRHKRYSTRTLQQATATNTLQALLLLTYYYLIM